MQTLLVLESARANIFTAATKPYLFTLKYRQKAKYPVVIFDEIVVEKWTKRWEVYGWIHKVLRRLTYLSSWYILIKWFFILLWAKNKSKKINHLVTPGMKRNLKIVGWGGRFFNDEDCERQRWVGQVIQDENQGRSFKP